MFTHFALLFEVYFILCAKEQQRFSMDPFRKGHFQQWYLSMG